MYWRRPSAAELAGIGTRPEDFAEPEVVLWPENEPPIHLFRDFSTQWRMGYGGPVGLDYNPILHELDRRDITAEKYDELMAAIRVIEGVALEELTKD